MLGCLHVLPVRCNGTSAVGVRYLYRHFLRCGPPAGLACSAIDRGRVSLVYTVATQLMMNFVCYDTLPLFNEAYTTCFPSGCSKLKFERVELDRRRIPHLLVQALGKIRTMGCGESQIAL